MDKKKPDWLVPGYPPLKGDDVVGQAAAEGQIYYPKVVRSQTDPSLVGQKIGTLSFMLFKEPRTLRNGKPAYGFVKLRGNWADETQAIFESTKIIREVDSRFQIRHAPVGSWVPITEENAFVKDLTDVHDEGDEIQLRSQAVKEKESERRRIAREIREREEDAKAGDIYDDPNSLQYYSMRRVTYIKLLESRTHFQNQLDGVESNMIKVMRELKKLEIDNPEYTEEWIECYNEKRREAGINDFIPREDLFDEYDSMKLEDLPEEEDDEGPST